ncbi:unnamed protein product [Colias eurytheme]|nr:unnamed protein product [Colias eurytheme]
MDRKFESNFAGSCQNESKGIFLNVSHFQSRSLTMGHAVCRSETYSTLPPEGIVINAIGISVVAVAILVLYTVRGTGGYRLRKVAQHPS